MRTRWMTLGMLAATACGGSDFAPPAPPSREQARDDVTTTWCNHANACGNIGQGKSYSTLDNCQVQTRAWMDGIWSAANCDGKINAATYPICLDTINRALCGDGLDSLEILDKCSAAKVCTP